mgnify:FL=1
MKAIFFEQHGDLEVLKFGEIKTPEPKVGEALIRVKAVALNHLDIWVRRGWKGLNLEMPHVTGSDVAGEIVSAPGSTFVAGQKVVINPGIVTTEDEWTRRGEDSMSPGYRVLGEQIRGGLAEYLVVPTSSVYKFPEGNSFPEAAASLLCGVTAWRMLFGRGNLKPGETVLVVGSGGGVNSVSIQMARAVGAYVIALAGSEQKCGLAEELGAHETINYSKVSEWHTEVLKRTKGRGVDVVVDNVGKATYPKSFTSVRRGGRVLTVGNTSGYDVQFDNRIIFAKQISLIGSTMGSRQDFIDSQNFLAYQGIKPKIDKVERLSEGIKMIKYLEEGRQFGKVVLEP